MVYIGHIYYLLWQLYKQMGSDLLKFLDFLCAVFRFSIHGMLPQILYIAITQGYN